MKEYVLVFLILTFISCGNKLDSKVENAVNILIEETSINTTFPEGNEAYKNLFRIATIEDLVYLTDNENPYVRYYSFIALREKNYPKIKEIFFSHKNDTETINTDNGACLKGFYSIKDLMLWALDPEYHSSKFGFSQSEYDKISKQE